MNSQTIHSSSSTTTTFSNTNHTNENHQNKNQNENKNNIVGWDESITKTISSSSSTTISSSSTTISSSSSSSSTTISSSSTKKMEKTTYDVNDYSRFDKINDTDDDVKDEGKKCNNCLKSLAKLKCSICKKATYCDPTCQRSDWIYHKRTCKKPEKKNNPNNNNSQNTSSNNNNSTDTVQSSTTTTTTSTTVKKSTNNGGVVKVSKEELNLKDVRGYKNGVPYFHRELSREEIALIGDIAPKKIDTTGPSALPPPDTRSHQGSAWNSAGTFEEKDLSTWIKRRLEDSLVPFELQLEKDVILKATEVKDFLGDANIFVVRGKKRYVYDFKLTVEWKVSAEGKKFTGKTIFDGVSNDSDYEIKTKWTKTPPASVLNLVNPSLTGKSCLLHTALLERLSKVIEEFQSQ